MGFALFHGALGLVLLLLAVLWPRPDSPLLALVRDDLAAASLFAGPGWQVLDMTGLAGFRLLHLIPGDRLVEEPRLPFHPGLVLLVSASRSRMCRSS